MKRIAAALHVAVPQDPAKRGYGAESCKAPAWVKRRAAAIGQVLRDPHQERKLNRRSSNDYVPGCPTLKRTIRCG